MTWYSIDAIEIAITRTKKTLIEPFNFWKWIKLGIIIILLGGGGGYSNFNMGNISPPTGGNEILVPSTGEVFDQMTQFWLQYMPLILVAAVIILALVVFFGIISNTMEFVLVNSLVTDIVSFWAYTSKYLRMGFNLFVVRAVLGIVFILMVIAGMYPYLAALMEGSTMITTATILNGIIRLIVVFLIVAVIAVIINSFINLSIPVAMYNDVGIIAAIKIILGKFGEDWKQILVYWAVRLILGIALGIIVAIVFFLGFLILFGFLALIGAILYLVFSMLGSDILMWVVLIPYILVLVVLFMVLLVLASVPVPVFMKFHLLTFLQSWYPEAKIPFFDKSMAEGPSI